MCRVDGAHHRVVNLPPVSVTLWLHPANLADCAKGIRIRVRRAVRGHTRRLGTAAEIVEAGIDATWNGRSFTASPAHFNTFWVRDMCFSAPALARLGERHRERLHASLAWALHGWDRRNRHITTTFHAFGHPADVYDYGVDSLPLFMAGLRAARANDLVDKHRAWLVREIDYFVDRVVDPESGLVRSDRKYSAHRDTVTNRSNAYGNSMVALLAKTLADESTGFNLPNPLARHFPDRDWGRLLKEHFWIPERGWYRDAIGSDETTGEANIWPFWTGVVRCNETLGTALATLEREGYASPYPLRYEVARRPEREVWLTRLLLPDYQGSSVWTSLGAMYLSLLGTIDRAKSVIETKRYEDWITRDGTYWEVLDDKGKCWVGRHRLMVGEESMLWGAIFLDHIRGKSAEPALLS
jgi:hypothetical protein